MPRRPLIVWPNFSRPNSLHQPFGQTVAGPGNKERARKPTHETETKLSNGGSATPALPVPLRSGHSPCLELFCCCGSLAGWAEEDFLHGSGDGVTEPALLSDDQLSQTLHCTLHHQSTTASTSLFCSGKKTWQPTQDFLFQLYLPAYLWTIALR